MRDWGGNDGICVQSMLHHLKSNIPLTVAQQSFLVNFMSQKDAILDGIDDTIGDTPPSGHAPVATP
jgi:hypothetical protein